MPQKMYSLLTHNFTNSAMWVAVGMLGIVSCGNNEVTVAPDSEDIDIVVHALMVEALLQDFTGSQRDTLSKLYYDELYDNFGIGTTQLDALRNRYSQQPELWAAVSDSVEARVATQRTDLTKLLNTEVMPPTN